MKEELLKEIAELVDLTQLGIIKGVEVLQAQAPDIIQQLLTWEVYENSIRFSISFFILISSLLIIKYWRNTLSKYTLFEWGDGSNPMPVFAWIYMVIAPIISVSVCINAIMQIAYIQIAPKVFLIKYLQSLL